jgi:hypothetical protein
MPRRHHHWIRGFQPLRLVRTPDGFLEIDYSIFDALLEE